MILDIILYVLFGLIYIPLSIIPNFLSFELPTGMVGFFLSLFDTLHYFLPLKDLLTMFSIYIAICNWDFIYKLISRVWGLLPIPHSD